jgi:hypothetical protein
MKTSLTITFFLFIFLIPIFSQTEIYELRVYEMAFFKPASVLHNYFEKAMIPALNRHGIKNVGVFEEAGEALPKKIYLLMAYRDMQSISAIADALAEDTQFQDDAKEYIDAPQEKIPFERISSSFMRSASGFPNLVKPNEDSEYFELRIYESHNEDALRRKVKMFNESEFSIFSEVGLNTVFFGQNISGHQMPCLTYLLAFKDKEAQLEAWSKFGPHPEWQRIRKLKEYENAMNDITRVFLKPLSYSQL